jgi:hypothetical protein
MVDGGGGGNLPLYSDLLALREADSRMRMHLGCWIPCW